MKIVSANITGSFILNGVDLTTTVESSSIWSGSISNRVLNLEQFSSSLDSTYATDAQLNSVTQSVNTLSSSFLSYTSSTDDKIAQLYAATASVNNATASLYAATSSLYAATASINSYTSSNNDSITDIRVATASLYAATSSINSYTASNNNNVAALYAATSSLYNATASIYGATSSLFNYSASSNLRINALDQYTASLNTRSASFACVTATNNFACTQYFSNASNAVSFTSTGSLYSDGGLRVTKDMYVSGTAFFNNVTVFGTQSVAYISSSQLNIGTNIISVNTDTPSIRFGGLAVYDSGSTGLTGSMLWDSEDNQWIYSNPSGSTYDSAVFLVGPRNVGVLGNEPGISCNFLSKGNGLHHMTSSGIFEDGSRTCFYGTSIITSTGVGCFSGAVCAASIVGGTVSGTTGTFSSSVNTSTFLRATGGTGATSGKGIEIGYEAGDFGTIIAYDRTTPGFKRLSLNDSLHITSGGNVGIGTTNPTSSPNYTSLSINGTTGSELYFKGGNTDFGYMYANSGIVVLATQIAIPLTFQTNTVERLRITSTGIACFACQVCAPRIVTNGIEMGGTAGSPSAAGIGYGMFGYSGVGLGISASANGANQGIGFFTCGDFERMRITTNGNVGIGTLCPSYTLDVCRSVDANFVARIANPSSTGFGLYIQANDNTKAGIRIANASGGTAIDLFGSGAATFSSSVTTNDTISVVKSKSGTGVENPNLLTLRLAGTGAIGDSANIAWRSSDGSYTIASINGISGGDNVAYGSISFSTRNYFTDTLSEVMRINNRGNVGIGTISPCAKLHIQGTGAGESLLYFCTGGSVNTKFAYHILSGADDAFILRRSHTTQGELCIMSWTYQGRVGIGTITPEYPLHIYCCSPTGMKIQTCGSSFGSPSLNLLNGGVDTVLSATNSGLEIGTWSANNILFKTTQQTRATIFTSGETCFAGTVCALSGVKFANGATTLNYYEEGSWTPALQNATVSYSDRSGSYVRIGNYVFVRWGFRISSISGQSGTVTISGLPFTSVNWGSYQEPNISVSTGGLSTADNAYRARIFVEGSGTSLIGRIANNSDTAWNTSDLQNGTWIIGEIYYNV